MQFDSPGRAIRKAHCGNTFAFTPSSNAILFPKPLNFTNTTIDGDRFYVGDVTDDIKIHPTPTSDATIQPELLYHENQVSDTRLCGSPHIMAMLVSHLAIIFQEPQTSV